MTPSLNTQGGIWDISIQPRHCQTQLIARRNLKPEMAINSMVDSIPHSLNSSWMVAKYFKTLHWFIGNPNPRQPPPKKTEKEKKECGDWEQLEAQFIDERDLTRYNPSIGACTAPLSKATSIQNASSSLIYNSSKPAIKPIPCTSKTLLTSFKQYLDGSQGTREAMEHSQPERIQHLCQTQNKLSEHCRGTSVRDHDFAGKRHEKGKYEIYLDLCPALKPMSHRVPGAAAKQTSMSIGTT